MRKVPKPGLILLHGWAMHSGVFAPVETALKAHFDLHFIDLPGHGRNNHMELSLPTCLAYLQDQLTPCLLDQPCWLLGWSLGGALATQIALQLQDHPIVSERLRGLIAVACTPCFVQRADWPHAVAEAQLQTMAQDLVSDRKRVVERFLALEVFGSAHEKQELLFLRQIVYQQGEPNPQALRAGLEILRDLDLRVALGAMRKPSLWLAGRRDRLCPPRAMQAAAELAGGQFVEMAGVAHAPFLTDHAAFVTAIVEFAKQ